MEDIRIKTGFKNCLGVDADRRQGGLALLWDEESDLIIKSYSKSHIDVEVTLKGRDGTGRLTGIYGQPKTHLRHETWSLLSNLSSQRNIPWLCMGDFNEILCCIEKDGQ
ncbi:hypothetical protein CFOL_v3_05920 [Cephalotus follicularis]|uniref:Exo_endo_phos domain-containing protein n=1 Tax=Cephalotus follicularis TaxID=3775 RepID=A0A1Q3B2Y4_CEPFO|nr:hypothetical protein CFOL_v3_05920 [Cephalotus follicularis]